MSIVQGITFLLQILSQFSCRFAIRRKTENSLTTCLQACQWQHWNEHFRGFSSVVLGKHGEPHVYPRGVPSSVRKLNCVRQHSLQSDHIIVLIHYKILIVTVGFSAKSQKFPKKILRSIENWKNTPYLAMGDIRCIYTKKKTDCDPKPPASRCWAIFLWESERALAIRMSSTKHNYALLEEEDRLMRVCWDKHQPLSTCLEIAIQKSQMIWTFAKMIPVSVAIS